MWSQAVKAFTFQQLLFQLSLGVGGIPQFQATIQAFGDQELHCPGDASCIKDAQLKELDSALGGALLDLIQFQGFTGAAVSTSRQSSMTTVHSSQDSFV